MGVEAAFALDRGRHVGRARAMRLSGAGLGSWTSNEVFASALKRRTACHVADRHLPSAGMSPQPTPCELDLNVLRARSGPRRERFWSGRRRFPHHAGVVSAVNRERRIRAGAWIGSWNDLDPWRPLGRHRDVSKAWA